MAPLGPLDLIFQPYTRDRTLLHILNPAHRLDPHGRVTLPSGVIGPMPVASWNRHL